MDDTVTGFVPSVADHVATRGGHRLHLRGERASLPRLCRRPRVPGGWSLLTYLAASLLVFGKSVLADPLHLLPGGEQWDPAQMAWFLTQTPHALLHAQNPFLTNLIDYPYGVNLMWNTLMPLAGVLAYPVTATVGPVAAWNLLFILGPAITAWTARLWIGRHVNSSPAAWLGGLLVGFSPFVAGHSLGQLNFVLLPLLPIMLILIEDLLWRRPRPQWGTGVLFGLTAAAQALLSEEIVVIVAVGVFIAGLAALLQRGRETLRAVAGAARGFSAAVIVFLVLVGYPLYIQLLGPHRVSDLRWRDWVAQPDNWVRPTSRIAIQFPLDALRTPGPQEEVTSYLGLPVLALVCVAVIALRRRLAARVAVITMMVGALLTLGSPHPGHGRIAILPRWLFNLPVLGNVLPLRYSLITDVALAILFATLVDELLCRWRRGQRRKRQVAMLVATSVAVTAVMPAALPAARKARVPPFFTTDAVKLLPEGAPVLVLPYPDLFQVGPMLWQAAADMRFRMPGGYALHPTVGGQPSAGGYPDDVESVYQAAGSGVSVSSTQLLTAKNLLQQRGIAYAVLDAAAPHSDALQRAVDATLGHGPNRTVGGVLVWLPPVAHPNR